MEVISHFQVEKTDSQKVKMSPELENSHGDIDCEVPDSSSHCRLSGGEGVLGVAYGAGGAKGKDFLSFSKDWTGCPSVCEPSL